MKPSKTLSLFAGMVLLASACGPRIYKFSVSPKTIGPNDTVHLNWKVKGKGVLKIRDYPYPNSGTKNLGPLTLVINRNGKDSACLLLPDIALEIPLNSEDSLTVRKKPDGVIDDRLRYFTLVASRGSAQGDSLVQVAVRPDSAYDEIATADTLRGDTLIGRVLNNPVRWGNNFVIQSITDVCGRPLLIWHAGRSASLQPGSTADRAFDGTPVQGLWEFRSPVSSAEKASRQFPKFLKISIIIKHH